MTPTEKKKIRALIQKYCLRCEAAERVIHYSQHRPMTLLGDVPEHGYSGDCSGYVTAAFYWANKWTPFHVADPNGKIGGREYSGWGYTGTLLDANHTHRVPLERKFFVGDISIYGPAYATRHTTICRKSGDIHTSIWSSHGSERGPYPTRLWYRRDLLGVYRPKSLL